MVNPCCRLYLLFLPFVTLHAARILPGYSSHVDVVMLVRKKLNLNLEDFG